MKSQSEQKLNDSKEENNKIPNAFSIPQISQPKGGGAIGGIGEKFSVNSVTGTGSISVPISTSPGRSGFGPQLSLQYDSGAGNGPFGLGWNLSIPSITRKTDRGLPRYQDDEESDVFILSGTEDLVPLLSQADGKWQRNTIPRRINGIDYRVLRYRPRIEGLFARIERWTNLKSGEMHWRSISKDNITTIYGKTPESRIADPDNPLRVFSWFICESYDDKGNAMRYEYKVENSQKVDTLIHERNRTDKTRGAQRYLKRIKYGNKIPRQAGEDLSNHKDDDWMFEVVFDYGEHYIEDNNHQPTFVSIDDSKYQWKSRKDPFSRYRAGFEIRTYRLCRNVLMFHHFPDELKAKDYLVHSTSFNYDELPVASFITSITQSGYLRQDDGTYLKKSLPPLEFEYAEAVINRDIEEISKESLQNLPYGLDGTHYQWVDLDGEGLSGILSEQGGTWFYKRNLSSLPLVGPDGKSSTTARFGDEEVVSALPSFSDLSSGRYTMTSLSGSGHLDIVKYKDSQGGFFERTSNEKWKQFVPFASVPNLRWDDPNLRFVDLTGDGLADILITEQEAFTWCQSLGKKGFGRVETIHKLFDEEKGPTLVFADGTQSIYVADMKGDGLSDLVRIRNGEVCYWPNLGYGKFGSKVTMDNSPLFDTSDQFDNRRIRLADIDGSGTTDIIYLGRKGAQLYSNLSGNSLDDPQILHEFPNVNNLSSATVLDLLGTGTSCLLWSSFLPEDVDHTMRYIDLMGGTKPHLLISVKNNLGSETKLHYAPSTKFYLIDKYAGEPWITKLPFPVQVVERVETFDWISRNYFVTSYKYHDGYFDGIEREFRGFGLVEQLDTEKFGTLSKSESFPVETATNIEQASSVPPVLTKTWFHTGIYVQGRKVSRHYESEYYREPALSDLQFDQQLLPDTGLSAGLTFQEEREACRALKGSILRQEIYALDNSAKSTNPYIISEHNYTIELVQRQGINQHGIFFVHPRETLDYHYERNPSDPRISHSLTLAVDSFGNVLRSASVGYGRRKPDSSLSLEVQAKQTQILVTTTENTFTNNIDLDGGKDSDDAYRTPLPYDNKTYELTGLMPDTKGRFTFSAIDNTITTATILSYENKPSGGVEKRLIKRVRVIYRKNDLSSAPGGTIGSLALPFETYELAFTSGLVKQVFDIRVTDGMFSNDGGYVHLDGDANWWIPSGKISYSPNATDTSTQELAWARAHFFIPYRYKDPFGNLSRVYYDDKYSLLLKETHDPLINIVTVVTKDDQGHDLINLDYRVLQPSIVTDPNGNRTAVAFDILGMVAFTAVMGKIKEPEGKPKGDILPKDREIILTDDKIDAFFEDPHGIAQKLLGSATTRVIYNVNSFYRTADPLRPVYAATIAREIHVNDPGGDSSPVQITFAYSDGFGRQVQKKVQAEPGNVEGVSADPRWVGSGWAIFNNKGKPVRQYEPFFSKTHMFEFAKIVGVSPILFYDPPGRVIATLKPNHTYEKVIFDSWEQESWDVNDTVLQTNPKNDSDIGDLFGRLPDTDYLPTWYQNRQDGSVVIHEKEAATKTVAHANTPTLSLFDTLGRIFSTIADNGKDGKYSTQIELDIEGNQRMVVDALGRIVMQYDYDMIGNQVKSTSMESGVRWLLNNVAGKPIYKWDSRKNRTRITYDPLQRPIQVFLQVDGAVESMVEKTVYGEEQGDGFNHKGRIYQRYDSAGLLTNEKYDFKGNLTNSSRKLAIIYKNTLDWSAGPQLDDQSFTTSTTYDALNRPTTMIAPDKSIITFTYNEASLLERLDVNLHGASQVTPFVKNIDYNAKGQRELVEYGNNVNVSYQYDSQTFRLIHLQTLRGSTFLQDLSYIYDPIGNITRIEDNSDIQNVVFFRNRRVEPSADYDYDAIYRLIQAGGREHLGLTSGGAINPPSPTSPTDESRMNLAHPGDGNAMGIYQEQYSYDPVGNILKIIHNGTDPANPGWSRTYTYNEPSLMESGKTNNRLSNTIVRNVTDSYTYDEHGNITSMPHIPMMIWDYKDQLQATSKQRVNNGGTPEITYYVYDGGGQRVRKVTERYAAVGQTPTRREERIYLGVFEIYRNYDGTGNIVTLEHQTLHVTTAERSVALIDFLTQGDDGSPTQSIRYQHDNHLGSATLELDALGEIISYEEYYPYGSTSYQAGRNVIEVKRKQYRYTSKERDEENGFYYHGARYYAPWLGRWTSCEPNGIADGLNAYEFVISNPIKHYDPDGFSWRSFAEGVLIGAGTALVVVAIIASAPVSIPAGAITALVVGGAAVTAGTAVQSVRQRDLFNNPISKEQADRQLGMLVGGAVVSAASGTISSGMTSASRALSSMEGSLVPAAGPSLATAVPAVVPATVPATAGLGTGAALSILMAAKGSGSKGGSSTPERKTGGSGPVKQGQRGIEQAKQAAKARGATVKGEEVTVKTSLGNRRIDLLTEEPTQQNPLTNVEVKTGGSRYTPLQQAKDVEIATKGGTAVGKNAEKAGVEGQKLIIPSKLERYP